MLVSIFTNVKNANKFLNQNKATAVYIAVMEVLFVHQFSKIKNVAEGLYTKKPKHTSHGFGKSAGSVLRNDSLSVNWCVFQINICGDNRPQCKARKRCKQSQKNNIVIIYSQL